jgi:hypothetical protein
MEGDITLNNQAINPAFLRASMHQMSRDSLAEEMLQKSSQYNWQSSREKTRRNGRSRDLIQEQSLNQPRLVKVLARKPLTDRGVVSNRLTRRGAAVSPQVVIDTNSLLYIEAKTIRNFPFSGISRRSSEPIRQAVKDTDEALGQFSLREGAEVRRFIGRSQSLLDLLSEARSHLSTYFPGSKLALRVITDPESVDDCQLVLFIMTNLAPENALSRLQQFDDAWWVDALDRAQGKLCITLEFPSDV